jgi:hypothetical protein
VAVGFGGWAVWYAAFGSRIDLDQLEDDS